MLAQAQQSLKSIPTYAGPYVPKSPLFEVLPALRNPAERNPKVTIDAFVDSHPEVRQVIATWYNNRHTDPDGTRDEARITGWGGGASALLDADSTGALAVFVFGDDPGVSGAAILHVWVCEGYQDEVIEDLVGPVEPKQSVIWRPGETGGLFPPRPPASSCVLQPSDMPADWLVRFPTAADIVRKTVELRPLQSQTPDDRLIRRRKCEFEIFQSVENALEGPKVKDGFVSLPSFLSLAQTILQRRKSRSGRSLELHAREIFLEEGLVEGQHFSHGARSEGDKKPDFLFPSAAAYADSAFPATRLRMLGAKTTVRDRWRQVLNEADRIPAKHLLTLQEGVSENQFAEMRAAQVQLVVPAELISAYPTSIQPNLMTLEQFICDVRLTA